MTRISEVHLPPDYANRGLSRIHMTRVGKVALLVGPNGSGKSRLLACLEAALQAQQVSGTVEKWREDLNQLQPAAKIAEESIRRIREASSSVPGAPRDAATRRLEEQLQKVRNLEQSIANATMLVLDAPISSEDERDVVHFRLTTPALTNHEKVLDEHRNQARGKLYQPKGERWAEHALSYIRQVQDEYIRATHHQVRLNSGSDSCLAV